MINTNPKREHRYLLRSCLICERLGTCIVRHEVNDSSLHADKAKYGCRLFAHRNPQIMNEPRKKCQYEK